MSPLVTMIILGYLLVIALCMTMWSALTLRNRSTDAETPNAEPERASARASTRASAAGGSTQRASTVRTELKSSRRSQSSDERTRVATHDAYRGAGLENASAPSSASPARERRTSPEATTGANQEPERSDEGKRSKEDPFERFLRANDDY